MNSLKAYEAGNKRRDILIIDSEHIEGLTYHVGGGVIGIDGGAKNGQFAEDAKRMMEVCHEIMDIYNILEGNKMPIITEESIHAAFCNMPKDKKREVAILAATKGLSINDIELYYFIALNTPPISLALENYRYLCPDKDGDADVH